MSRLTAMIALWRASVMIALGQSISAVARLNASCMLGIALSIWDEWMRLEPASWPAPGSEDTELGVLMELEVVMERRKFSWESKLEAVRLIKDRGVSCAQASADLNLHTSQLRDWVKKFADDPQHAFPGNATAIFDDPAKRVAPRPGALGPSGHRLGGRKPGCRSRGQQNDQAEAESEEEAMVGR